MNPYGVEAGPRPVTTTSVAPVPDEPLWG